MPWLDFRQAQAEVGLAEVLALLGWVARARVGARVRGPCLVHGSSSPSSRVFAAHLGRGVWHCFRCGASGKALDLWAHVTQQAIYPAALDLYRRLGRTPPWRRPSPWERQKNL
jgi:hypothetical protein